MRAWQVCLAAAVLLAAVTVVSVKWLGGPEGDESLKLMLPGSAGTGHEPPQGMHHGLGYAGGEPSADEGRLQVEYQTTQDASGKAVTDVVLRNEARRSAHYTLFLSGPPRKLLVGQWWRLHADVSADGVDDPVELALGYQFFNADGSYLSDMASAEGTFRPSLAAPQPLRAEFVGGQIDPSSLKVPAMALPRVAVYNIPPGATVRIRLSNWGMDDAPAQTGVQVMPFDRPFPSAAPGQVWPLTVRLQASPQAAPLDARLVLIKDGVRAVAFNAAAPLSLVHWGPVQQMWRVRLPKDLEAGVYQAQYEVPSLQLVAPLGALTVAPDAGMWVGMGIHRYPGSSEQLFGPYQGRYQFVRSLASDEAHRMQWWLAPDRYDWSGLMKWAAFHAPKGEKKVVMTFSGSPQWASMRPGEPAAMGVPGGAAPPAREYWGAYERMVRETVKHMGSRMLASECWNEPNSTAFFTGSSTELADLCKIVYQATKSVDAAIPVICPQADDPRHLDAVYAARTSDGEPIYQFCDLVGAHIYNRLADDVKGQPYARQRLQDALALMVDMGRKYGVDKPLAVTEFGLDSCVVQSTAAHPDVFGRMSSEEAAEALYQTVAGFRSFGVQMLGLYSYDHPDNDPRCRPGGSFIHMTKLDQSGRMKIDAVVANRVGDAVLDFGKAKP
ncbi:hypothetical protein [Aquabacterium sp.]|uniref:hypothetical protein n=1 Tax=Aquabacterium sp. TaxID=1872578 RepID=UPI0035AF2A98